MQYPAASILVVLCLLTVAAHPTVALGQDKEASTGLASDDSTTVDNVVVSQKSTSELRKDVFQAEDDFYSVFNKLNDNKDFDVRCGYEKATGSNIKNHVCRARFVTKAYERHARRNRNDLSRTANQSSDPVFAAQTIEYEEKVDELITANPELQAAFDRYNEARVQFMVNREENASN
jgi:hypothetical protein